MCQQKSLKILFDMLNKTHVPKRARKSNFIKSKAIYDNKNGKFELCFQIKYSIDRDFEVNLFSIWLPKLLLILTLILKKYLYRAKSYQFLDKRLIRFQYSKTYWFKKLVNI